MDWPWRAEIEWVLAANTSQALHIRLLLICYSVGDSAIAAYLGVERETVRQQAVKLKSMQRATEHMIRARDESRESRSGDAFIS